MKIDTLETVPPHVAIAAGLGGKAILLINGDFRTEATRCSKYDHFLHDGSVRLDFMTDASRLACVGSGILPLGKQLPERV
jgi:hypothetical protein